MHARRWCSLAVVVVLLGSLACAVPGARTQPPEEVVVPPPPALQGEVGPPKEWAQAITRGLEWLALHQAPDGHWGLNDFNRHARTKPVPGGKIVGDNADPGTPYKNDVAGTAFGLLPFLAAGHTHKAPPKGDGPTYDKTVLLGLQWLLQKQARDGSFNFEMYSNALAVFAVCEAYGMTSDPMLKVPAQRALNFIVGAQDPKGGGWRYAPKMPGDLSVTGFQMTALKSGQLAGLQIPNEVFQKAEKFIDSCQNQDRGYGYMPTTATTPAMTAAGALCRQYLGANPRNPGLQKSVEILKKRLPAAAGKDYYYLFYATRVMHRLGGEDWKSWSQGPEGKGGLTEMLVKAQVPVVGKASEAGSWAPDAGVCKQGGRLMSTSLALLMLELHSSRLPVFRRGP